MQNWEYLFSYILISSFHDCIWQNHLALFVCVCVCCLEQAVIDTKWRTLPLVESVTERKQRRKAKKQKLKAEPHLSSCRVSCVLAECVLCCNRRQLENLSKCKSLSPSVSFGVFDCQDLVSVLLESKQVSKTEKLVVEIDGQPSF